MTHTLSEQELFSFAKDFASTLHGGDVILLSGNLGAGKTTFTKGVAEGLGILDDVTSPTFALMQVYALPEPQRGAKELIHIDTYRVNNESELINIGVQDYLGNDTCITIIEWPDKLQELIQHSKLKKIEIRHTKDPLRRTISIT